MLVCHFTHNLNHSFFFFLSNVTQLSFSLSLSQALAVEIGLWTQLRHRVGGFYRWSGRGFSIWGEESRARFHTGVCVCVCVCESRPPLIHWLQRRPAAILLPSTAHNPGCFYKAIHGALEAQAEGLSADMPIGAEQRVHREPHGPTHAWTPETHAITRCGPFTVTTRPLTRSHLRSGSARFHAKGLVTLHYHSNAEAYGLVFSVRCFWRHRSG